MLIISFCPIAVTVQIIVRLCVMMVAKHLNRSDWILGRVTTQDSYFVATCITWRSRPAHRKGDHPEAGC